MVGGLGVRNRLNDHPMIVYTHAVGPPRLVKHLLQFDGTNLRELGLGTDGWELNTLMDVTETPPPLTAAERLLRSSRVRSVHVITTAFHGLFTGWFGALCRRRTPAAAIRQASPALQSMARSSHNQPA
ncbi:MAG: hypothetical protein ACJATT_001926 [Myxococcota bacterium]|jgi:hypothetical protein